MMWVTVMILMKEKRGMMLIMKFQVKKIKIRNKRKISEIQTRKANRDNSEVTFLSFQLKHVVTHY